MLKELLGDLYTEEIASKLGDVKLIVDDGSLVPKYKYDEDIEKLNAIIAERDRQLEDLENSSGDAEKLQKEISKLRAENKASKEEYEAHIAKQAKEYAITARLIEEGAVNAKAVTALLDTEKISFEDGKLVGMDEQISAIKEENAWAFGMGIGVPGGGINPPSGDSGKAAPTGPVAI